MSRYSPRILVDVFYLPGKPFSYSGFRVLLLPPPPKSKKTLLPPTQLATFYSGDPDLDHAEAIAYACSTAEIYEVTPLAAQFQYDYSGRTTA